MPKKIVPKIVQRGIKDFFNKNEFNQNVVTSLDKSLSLLNLQDGPTSTDSAALADSTELSDSTALIDTTNVSPAYQTDPAIGNNAIEYNPERITPRVNFPKSRSGRKFNAKWYDTYDFIEYGISTDRVYCRSCRLFGSSFGHRDSAFSEKGFNDWGHPGRIELHGQSIAHIEAYEKQKSKTFY
jgi:hypothetical protein